MMHLECQVKSVPNSEPPPRPFNFIPRDGSPMKYQALRPKLKTGDVILFSGKGGISEGIKFFTVSKWSHVGMVYRFDDPLDKKGTVFCWESTTLSDLADADTGKLTKGVQRVELSERLERCFARGYEISVRPLSQPLTEDQIRALNDFRHEVGGRPYEKKKLQLLKSAYDGLWGGNKEDLSSLFCSELVAEAYQRMGLLSEAIPSNEYTPKDFSVERTMALQGGFSFRKEIPVTSL
ncbi:MAG: hypothetical protein FJ404_14820 [Verrucomicrobia bacterium]|nr:hypothetical protein [Verrucomicrobiota bacterium]